MKFFPFQIKFLIEKKSTRSNLKRFLFFVAILLAVILFFSLLFQMISRYEGHDPPHNLIDALYWTLVTMATLGYGDIVLTSDLGRIFSSVVLVTGVISLLVMLPFTFIQFFYEPWLKAQEESRAPRKVPSETRDHILITKFNPVAAALIEQLQFFQYEYWIVIPDLKEVLEVSDLGYNVIFGHVDDPRTWHNVKVQNAALVVANDNERVNTNVTFTIRELDEEVPVVSFTNMDEAVDILKLAGSNLVLNLSRMMGQSLARRVVSGSARVHVIGRFKELVVAEAPAVETPLVGYTLAETRLRELTGVNVVGIWESGQFRIASSDSKINEKSILVLVGTVRCLRKYDELMGIYHASDAPVVILGGGRVGEAVAKALEERQIQFRIIEKRHVLTNFQKVQVLGDAADLNVLEKAGINEAHTIIITPNQDDTNIYLTLYCRRLRPDIQIISRATLDRNLDTLRRAGADFTLSYANMGANAIFNYLQLGEMVVLAEGLNVFKIAMPEKIIGHQIKELNLRDETGCTIVGIEQEDEIIFQPSPDFRLERDQKIVLIGTLESEKKIWNMYNGGKPMKVKRKSVHKI